MSAFIEELGERVQHLESLTTSHGDALAMLTTRLNERVNAVDSLHRTEQQRLAAALSKRTELLARMAAEIAGSLVPRFNDDEMWGPGDCSAHKARIEQVGSRGVIAQTAVDIARRILKLAESSDG
jgi:hypothetical protein